MLKKSSQPAIRINLFVLLAASMMFLVILAVPTMIVVPFIDPGGMERTATAMKENETEGFAVEVARTASGTVETVPLETYVLRVTASEMPADFELEALKAQAVAARTYVVRYMEENDQNQPETIQVSDTVSDQVYKNDDELKQVWGKDYEWKIAKLQEAVNATAGKIITYDSEPITPAFFSTSNGYTENAEDYWENALPYLKSVKSPWDKDSPKFSDQVIFTAAEVEEKLGVTLADAAEPGEIKRNESERVAEVSLGGQTFTGREVREKLGLRSTDFTITLKDGHYIFETKGYGHGVGMSQYGANGMAKEGRSYADILAYYYTDTELTELPPPGAELAAK